jgi:hypothetical protein
MANLYGRELPNQWYTGTKQLLGQPKPSTWLYNPGAGSYSVDGKQILGQPRDLGKDYLGQYNALTSPKAGQVEGGAAQGFFYNPTGKPGGFRPRWITRRYMRA